MSTDKPSSEGNPTEAVSLREYIERVMDMQSAALGIAAHASEEAAKIRSLDLDRRLAELNKLREEVTNDRGQYMSRDVYDVQHERLTSEIKNIESRMQVQIDDLKRSRAIIVGASLVLVPLAGVIGAAIVKAL